MNFLSHGRSSLGDPWLLAGTALPDWLRVLEPPPRVDKERAESLLQDADPRCAALAAGALRHLADDAAFHQSPAFRAATHAVAGLLRPLVPEFPGLRPSFVAHILVEVLLDAEIARADPRLLGAYYDALGTLDLAELERIAARLTPEPPTGLARLVQAFIDARFLGEYAEDAGVARRIDQVFRRVGTQRLGRAVEPVLPAARTIVAAAAPSLLASLPAA